LRRTATTLALCAWGVALLAPLAAAQTVSPSTAPTPGERLPTVSGSVTGTTTAGGHLTVEISAVDVRGWRNLGDLGVEVLSGGSVIDEVRYEVENSTLYLGSTRIKVGTGSSGESNYFGTSGARVIVTTGGGRMFLVLELAVLKALPEGVRFRLTAADYAGRSAAVVRSARAPGGNNGGFGWGTVVTAVVVALVAGALVGNVFASNRRPPPGLSVYGAVQRRVREEQRAETPSKVES
jgi:hypothetical protein